MLYITYRGESAVFEKFFLLPVEKMLCPFQKLQSFLKDSSRSQEMLGTPSSFSSSSSCSLIIEEPISLTV